MNKNWIFLAVVVLAIVLMSFAFDRIVPGGPAHTAKSTQPVIESAGGAGEGAVPVTRLAMPFAFVVVIGVLCTLFGLMAVTPLLVDGTGGDSPLLHRHHQSPHD